MICYNALPQPDQYFNRPLVISRIGATKKAIDSSIARQACDIIKKTCDIIRNQPGIFKLINEPTAVLPPSVSQIIKNPGDK
jgi:hypothetical protein